MNVKYDWAKLRRKYLTGDYATIKEFAEYENIPYLTVRKHSAEWITTKRTETEYKENKIAEKVLEKQIITASDINVRHIKLFNEALDIAECCLKSCADEGVVNIARFEKVVDSLSKIQKAQRLALGMDRDGGNQAAEDNVARVFALMKKAFGNG